MARRALPVGFPPAEQEDFGKAQRAFFDRLSAAAKGPDGLRRDYLEPGGRWNNLINAICTYISGGDADRLSVKDFENYDGNENNWRVVEGYGSAIAAYGGELRVALDCPVLQIDHTGKRLKIETARGVITADQAIITLPTSILGDKEFLFAPALPEKTEAARGLPLGLDNKLFLSLDKAEEFDKDTPHLRQHRPRRDRDVSTCGRSAGRRSRSISAAATPGGWRQAATQPSSISPRPISCACSAAPSSAG